jgi:hypothetical protein
MAIVPRPLVPAAPADGTRRAYVSAVEIQSGYRIRRDRRDERPKVHAGLPKIATGKAGGLAPRAESAVI